MIDHMSVGVDDVDSAKDFHTKTLGELVFGLLAELPGLLAYAENSIQFLAMRPLDAFRSAAIASCATFEDGPGTRAYPHAEVYAAYVRDPFGRKFEVLTNGFAPK